MESKGQNSFFFEKSHAAYQIKGNDTYNNMEAMILSLNAPSTPGVRSKSLNRFFSSESSHVAYQIKGIETYDNMQANMLPLHTPSTPGWDLTVKHFCF